MKLNDSFILHDENNEKILVSDGTTKFVGLVHSNVTAGFIISCLRKETTENQIVAKMLKKWEVSEEIARRDVKKVISQLRKIGAIDD